MEEYVVSYVSFRNNPHNGDYARVIVWANNEKEAVRAARAAVHPEIGINSVKKAE